MEILSGTGQHGSAHLLRYIPVEQFLLANINGNMGVTN